MTPSEYRASIARLGLSQVAAGEFLGVATRTSWGYANGEPIPRATAMLLRLMVARGIAPDDLPRMPSPVAAEQP